MPLGVVTLMLGLGFYRRSPSVLLFTAFRKNNAEIDPAGNSCSREEVSSGAIKALPATHIVFLATALAKRAIPIGSLPVHQLFCNRNNPVGLKAKFPLELLERR